MAQIIRSQLRFIAENSFDSCFTKTDLDVKHVTTFRGFSIASTGGGLFSGQLHSYEIFSMIVKGYPQPASGTSYHSCIRFAVFIHPTI